MSSVGIKEGSLQVYDGLAAPVQNKSGILRYNGNGYCLQVLLCGVSQELIHILRIYDNCHTLLRLGNGKLRAIQTSVLLGYLVKIYGQACCQLTDGNGYAACTKVITLLNNAANLFTTEESLNLSLGRRITLLYLSATGLNGSLGVYLRGTSCTATAITTRTAAQQDNDVARIRILTNDVLSGSSTHNGTDLHSLCHVIRMINLFYKASCKTNLVTIGGITGSGTANKLLLGKLTL